MKKPEDQQKRSSTTKDIKKGTTTRRVGGTERQYNQDPYPQVDDSQKGG